MHLCLMLAQSYGGGVLFGLASAGLTLVAAYTLAFFFYFPPTRWLLTKLRPPGKVRFQHPPCLPLLGWPPIITANSWPWMDKHRLSPACSSAVCGLNVVWHRAPTAC